MNVYSFVSRWNHLELLIACSRHSVSGAWAKKKASERAGKKRGETGEEDEGTPVKLILKSSWQYTRFWYTLWLAKFDTSCQHQRVVDADKKCDVACPCEGHPPLSHARLNNCTASAWRFPKCGYFTNGIKRLSSKRVSGKRSHRHSSNRIWK